MVITRSSFNHQVPTVRWKMLMIWMENVNYLIIWLRILIILFALDQMWYDNKKACPRSGLYSTHQTIIIQCVQANSKLRFKKAENKNLDSSEPIVTFEISDFHWFFNQVFNFKLLLKIFYGWYDNAQDV